MSRMSGSSVTRDGVRKPLKSPLRNATMPLVLDGAEHDPRDPRPRLPADVTPQQLRQSQISEFTAWLRTQTNKHKRPFQADTIIGYAEAARVLDRWMAEEETGEDFTGCTVDLLNRFFAAYRNAHTQNGTNTRQRNLHHIAENPPAPGRHLTPWNMSPVAAG